MISEAGREGGVEGAGGASEPSGMFWGPDLGRCRSARTEYLRCQQDCVELIVREIGVDPPSIA
eukprot:2064110-Rhodomonas_salina.1